MRFVLNGILERKGFYNGQTYMFRRQHHVLESGFVWEHECLKTHSFACSSNFHYK